jgi:two-component system NarL family sensor kinase
METGSNELSESIVFIISGICFFLLLGGFNIYFLFFYRRKQYQNEQEKKQLELKYSQALLQAQVEIQEELLQHISREVHDNLGQVAALIKLNLAAFPADLSDDASRKLEETRHLMKKLMLDIKTLSLSLNTDYLSEEGLIKAIEGECKRLNQINLFTVDFTTNGLIYGLDSGKQIFLYRMFQELISNIFKYAEASLITVIVDIGENELLLQVADNGKGFHVEEVMRKSLKQQSTGLRGLQKRADLIGANLHIQSEPGKGTTIKICLPLVAPI